MLPLTLEESGSAMRLTGLAAIREAANLPVQAPTKLELVINSKTAKAA